MWQFKNLTWKIASYKSESDIIYGNNWHLIWTFPLAVILIVFRFNLEKYWFSPIEQALNPLLEINKKVEQEKQTDLNNQQIHRWWQKRSLGKPLTLPEFNEIAWKCFYYVYSFIYGLFALFDKPWLWDVKEFWTNYPHQVVENDIWWYLIVSIGFYWSEIITHLAKKKHIHLWSILTYNIIIVFLLNMSWTCNLYRLSSLILLIHDCSNIFLECTRLSKYIKYRILWECSIIIFVTTWIVILYPDIIYVSLIDGPKSLHQPFVQFFVGLLITLQCLYIIWTYMILKRIFRKTLLLWLNCDVHSYPIWILDYHNSNALM